jgi:hypothetical protein
VNKLTWQAVGLIAILGAVTTGLAILTDWGSGEILGLVGILAGLGGGAAVAGGVSGQLTSIQHRVNGELDQRISAAVEHGNQTILTVLREQGVIR